MVKLSWVNYLGECRYYLDIEKTEVVIGSGSGISDVCSTVRFDDFLNRESYADLENIFGKEAVREIINNVRAMKAGR